MRGFFERLLFRVFIGLGFSLIVSFTCSVKTGIYTLCKNTILRCCPILRGIRNSIILDEVLFLVIISGKNF